MLPWPLCTCLRCYASCVRATLAQRAFDGGPVSIFIGERRSLVFSPASRRRRACCSRPGGAGASRRLVRTNLQMRATACGFFRLMCVCGRLKISVVRIRVCSRSGTRSWIGSIAARADVTCCRSVRGRRPAGAEAIVSPASRPGRQRTGNSAAMLLALAPRFGGICGWPHFVAGGEPQLLRAGRRWTAWQRPLNPASTTAAASHKTAETEAVNGRRNGRPCV